MMTSEMNIELAVRYITGSASEAERKSFDSWLQDNTGNRDQYEAFRSYWEIAGSSYDNYEPDLLKGWENVSRETVHKKVATFRQKSVSIQLLKIAAGIVLLLAGWYGGRLVINKAGKPESQLFVYQSAENIKKLQLNDGTLIWLNKNSEVRIPADFNKKRRTVTLLGEAYFKVAKNENKPFTIYAGRTITKVLGTSFNLRAIANEEKTRITVFSGRVAFYPLNNKKGMAVLVPGNRGVYDKQTKTIRKELVYMPNDLAWKTGTLRFKNTSLANVCQTLSEYYHVQIIADKAIADNKLFTGNFRNATLNEILDIIEYTLDIEFVKNGNKILAEP